MSFSGWMPSAYIAYETLHNRGSQALFNKNCSCSQRMASMSRSESHTGLGRSVGSIVILEFHGVPLGCHAISDKRRLSSCMRVWFYLLCSRSKSCRVGGCLFSRSFLVPVIAFISFKVRPSMDDSRSRIFQSYMSRYRSLI